jgi:hypothetical protein
MGWPNQGSLMLNSSMLNLSNYVYRNTKILYAKFPTRSRSGRPVWAKCSLLGSCLLWLKKFRSSPNFWATFFHGKSNVLLLTKMGWATFWAIFSQTLLVTVIEIKVLYFVLNLVLYYIKNGIKNLIFLSIFSYFSRRYFDN